VRSLLLKHIPDYEEILLPHPKYGFYFCLMTDACKVDDVKRLAQRIAALYSALHEVRNRT
jgi:deferrochelatase/peroxidase EfeB